MELSPNQLILLLKIRRLYMMDDFLRNGFKSRNELGTQVMNCYDPNPTVKKFINSLMEYGVLYLQGSLKLNLKLCDQIIKDCSHYDLFKSYLAEDYNLIAKSFFE